MNNTIEDDLRAIWRYPNKGIERIIFINVSVFILLLVGNLILKGGFTEWLAMPIDLKNIPLKFWTPITSFFSHLSFFDLVASTLWLYFFGRILIDLIGNEKLIAIYFLGGILGSIGVLIASQWTSLLENQQYYIGSSACTFAVVTATTTLTPNYRVKLILIGATKLKYIFAVAMAYFLFQWFGNKNSVSHLLSLLGIGTGYAYMKLLQKGHDYGHWIIICINSIADSFNKKSKLKVNRKKEKKRQPKEKARNSKNSKSKNSESVSQDEVDEILNKIQAHGYDSLTKEEKEKLFNS